MSKRFSNSDYELSLDAVLRGSRGNLMAAYLGAFESLDGGLRDAVCGRVSSLADECPHVPAGTASSFGWVDGSTRARYAYDGRVPV